MQDILRIFIVLVIMGLSGSLLCIALYMADQIVFDSYFFGRINQRLRRKEGGNAG